MFLLTLLCQKLYTPKRLMIGVLILVGLILVGIFVSDWVFNRELLTETLVGILIREPTSYRGI